MPRPSPRRCGYRERVRRFASWSRWVALAMLAHTFLAVVRADEHTRHPGVADLIPLTCNEIQRPFITLVVRPVHDAAHRLPGPTDAAAIKPAPGQPLQPTGRESGMKIILYSRHASLRT